MGKKTVMIWAVIGLFCSILFTGCGPMGQIRNVVNSSENENRGDAGETADSNTNSNTDGISGDIGKEDETAPAVPVFGAENAQGYDGFQYLYEETLTAYMDEDEESGRIKRKAVTVYIPEEGSSGISVDMPGTKYADAQGVLFQFSLNPYMIDRDEKKSLEEKLREYVNEIYDNGSGTGEEAYEMGYEDLEISDAGKLGQDAASITVKYCLFDEWDKEYSVVFCTYYLKQLEPGLLALLEIEIDSREATSKTTELLEEIEAFYEVDLGWDSQKAQKKLDDYLAYMEENGRTIGMLRFRLPEGWKLDNSYSDRETFIYAPGGDSDGAGCGIGIVGMYAGIEAEELIGWLGDEGDIRTYMEEAMGGSDDDFSLHKVENCGETYIGETVMVEFTYREEGEMTDCRMYIGAKGDYVYVIVAMQYQWLEMDTFEVADKLLENGG